jgi:hypothetical protein
MKTIPLKEPGTKHLLDLITAGVEISEGTLYINGCEGASCKPKVLHIKQGELLLGSKPITTTELIKKIFSSQKAIANKKNQAKQREGDAQQIRKLFDAMVAKVIMPEGVKFCGYRRSEVINEWVIYWDERTKMVSQWSNSGKRPGKQKPQTFYKAYIARENEYAQFALFEAEVRNPNKQSKFGHWNGPVEKKLVWKAPKKFFEMLDVPDLSPILADPSLKF